MSDEDHRCEYDDKIGRMAAVVTRNRCDPERLAAVKRILTGNTRCPECDALNPADQESCSKCGARLYPGSRDAKDEKNPRI